MPSDSPYIHGTAPDEQARLARLNDMINRRCLEELALAPGQRIIDIGSGLGALTALCADAVGPTGFALGIERHPDQLAKAIPHAATRTNLAFREGSAFDLPLDESEAGTFDIAFIRFLLEHVRDPVAGVREAVRAVKPGGRIVLADDHHALLVLHPPCPAFDRIWQDYIASYHRIGCDPAIGIRLVQLLHQAGATPVRNTFLFFGACAGQDHFGALIENMIGCVASARDLMVREGLTDAPSIDRAFADTRAWAERPDAALWYPMCWAEGVRL
jgi:ubiquinone/menaquinone biosynthesis C-methylase UbiE